MDSSGPFQLVILVLSLAGLAAVGADTVLDLPAPVHNLIQLADTAICFVLLGDFFIRFYRAVGSGTAAKWRSSKAGASPHVDTGNAKRGVDPSGDEPVVA